MMKKSKISFALILSICIGSCAAPRKQALPAGVDFDRKGGDLAVEILKGINEKELLVVESETLTAPAASTDKNLQLLIMSHFNNREFPDIENRVGYKGDDFDFQRDRVKFGEVRENRKYLLIKTSFLNSYLAHSKYNFAEQCYNLKQIPGFIEDDGPLAFTKPLTLKIIPDDAEKLQKGFLNGKAGLYILARIKEVDVDERGIFKVKKTKKILLSPMRYILFWCGSAPDNIRATDCADYKVYKDF